MLRRFRILLSVLILLAPATRAEESESHRQSPVLHPDDFWVQDFENRDATFSPVVEHTSTLYEVISQSVVEEKPAFGKRCAKAEYLFKRRGYFYLRLDLGSAIAVGDTGYFSCRIKSTGATFYGILVHGKRCDSVEELPGGWLQVASNKLHGEIKSIMIRFHPIQEGARIIFYLDDLRLSRSKTLLPPGADELARLTARWHEMLDDLPALLRRVKDEKLKLQLEQESRNLEQLAALIKAASFAALSRGKFAGAMQEFDETYWKAKWKVFIDQAKH